MTFSLGTVVRIMRSPEADEDPNESWESELDDFVGQDGYALATHDDGDVLVRIFGEGSDLWLPAAILEEVVDSAHAIDPMVLQNRGTGILQGIIVQILPPLPGVSPRHCGPDKFQGRIGWVSAESFSLTCVNCFDGDDMESEYYYDTVLLTALTHTPITRSEWRGMGGLQ